LKDFFPEQFEAELRHHQPAPPPAELLARLRAARTVPSPGPAKSTAKLRDLWLALRWWLAPAAAVLVAALLILRAHLPTPEVKADDIQIQRELVNSFDTVAKLPSGEPVRFRCREWVDEVTLRDKTRGLVLERRSPRVEVVPVRFETY
jgi:hypothetical protein